MKKKTFAFTVQVELEDDREAPCPPPSLQEAQQIIEERINLLYPVGMRVASISFDFDKKKA